MARFLLFFFAVFFLSFVGSQRDLIVAALLTAYAYSLSMRAKVITRGRAGGAGEIRESVFSRIAKNLLSTAVQSVSDINSINGNNNNENNN